MKRNLIDARPCHSRYYNHYIKLLRCFYSRRIVDCLMSLSQPNFVILRFRRRDICREGIEHHSVACPTLSPPKHQNGRRIEMIDSGELENCKSQQLMRHVKLRLPSKRLVCEERLPTLSTRQPSKESSTPIRRPCWPAALIKYR